MQNGFLERGLTGQWAWQRPALAPATEAPFGGLSLGYGLIMHSDTLYGVGASTSGTGGLGTATTWGVSRIQPTTFLLTAGSLSFGTDTAGNQVYNIGYLTGILGGLAPTTWKGLPVFTLNASQPPTGGTQGFHLGLTGTASATQLSYIKINGQAFFTNTASFAVDTSGISGWSWFNVMPLPAAGVYSGTFF